MTESLEIQPVVAPIRGAIRPPGSKSVTNRALVCAALAAGESKLTGALASEDTEVMIDALGALGITIVEEPAEQALRVTGCAGKIPSHFADLYIANSGTTVRFLTALVSLGHGIYRLHGTPRMHERPIQDLLDSLVQLGVDAASEAGSGCPPVMVRAGGLQLNKVSIRGDVSSQFLSALLLAAPCAEGDAGSPIEVVIDGPLVSQPYVRMTVAVMQAFGAQVAASENLGGFEVARSGYVGRTYDD